MAAGCGRALARLPAVGVYIPVLVSFSRLLLQMSERNYKTGPLLFNQS